MTEAERHYEKMTKTPVSKLITRLGIPTTVSMLISNIYNLADTYFVGTLGDSAQGATGILFTLQTIIQAIAFMLGHGAGVYVSKCLADKNREEATEYASSAFLVGALSGTLLSVVGLSLLEPFLYLLGSTDTILPHAKDYGLWILIACPFLICSLILNNVLRYEGKAFFAMIGLGIGGLLNIFGDWLFVHRLSLGVFGAGLSTAISQIVSFLLLLILYFKKAQSTISIRSLSRRGILYWNVIRMGFPSLIRQGLTSVSNGILNNLAKPFGDAAIAAMSVVNRVNSFVMCVGLGVGQGFQPVASFNYQAKEYSRVKKGLTFTIFLGFILIGTLSLGVFLLATPIVTLLQKEQAVIDIAVPALRYACLGLLFLPLSIPVNMLYQSIRRAGISSFLSLLRSGLVLIPALFIGAHLFGLKGIQWSQPIADIAVGCVSIPFTLYFLFKTPNTEQKTAEKA